MLRVKFQLKHKQSKLDCILKNPNKESVKS